MVSGSSCSWPQWQAVICLFFTLIDNTSEKMAPFVIVQPTLAGKVRYELLCTRDNDLTWLLLVWWAITEWSPHLSETTEQTVGWTGSAVMKGYTAANVKQQSHLSPSLSLIPRWKSHLTPFLYFSSFSFCRYTPVEIATKSSKSLQDEILCTYSIY